MAPRPSPAKLTSVTPQIGFRNHEVAFELTGTGICQNVSVTLGDGIHTRQLGVVSFNPNNNYKWPFKATYGYTGSYTLVVHDTGASGCGVLESTLMIVESPQIKPLLQPITSKPIP